MLFLCASVINRPFPSSPRPLYQNEVKCAVFNMEMNFHPHANKTHFHQKGCALDLILKVRILRTRKWPIHVRVGINIAGKIAALESAASTSTSTILKYHCGPPSATLLEMSNFSFIFYHFVALCSLGNHCAVAACNPIEQNMLGALLLARLQSVSESLLFSGRAVYEAIS